MPWVPSSCGHALGDQHDGAARVDIISEFHHPRPSAVCNLALCHSCCRGGELSARFWRRCPTLVPLLELGASWFWVVVSYGRPATPQGVISPSTSRHVLHLAGRECIVVACMPRGESPVASPVRAQEAGAERPGLGLIGGCQAPNGSAGWSRRSSRPCEGCAGCLGPGRARCTWRVSWSTRRRLVSIDLRGVT